MIEIEQYFPDPEPMNQATALPRENATEILQETVMTDQERAENHGWPTVTPHDQVGDDTGAEEGEAFEIVTARADIPAPAPEVAPKTANREPVVSATAIGAISAPQIIDSSIIEHTQPEAEMPEAHAATPSDASEPAAAEPTSAAETEPAEPAPSNSGSEPPLEPPKGPELPAAGEPEEPNEPGEPAEFGEGETPQDLTDGELAEADLAQMRYNFRVIVPPTHEETDKIRDKESSVEWLGFVTTKSPIAETFGDEDDIAAKARWERGTPYEEGSRIPPEESERLVNRQLKNMSSTLKGIEVGIQASGDLAELATEHEGRTLSHENELGLTFGGRQVPVLSEGRYAISTRPQTPPLVDEVLPPSNRPDDAVRVDTPDDEVHLIAKDGSERVRIWHDTDAGRVNVVREQKYTVNPDDGAYFNTLHDDLARHQNLLLDVAELAGFDRANIIDQSGQVNVGFLLAEVDPVVSSAEFQAKLPTSIRAALEVSAELIARRVNPTYRAEDNLSQKGLRLGGYFRLAIGRYDS